MSEHDDRGSSDVWEDYVDEAWLGRLREEILDPALAIIDPHHHLWWRQPVPYRFENLLDDLASGHNVEATVYMEAGAMYRAGGPEHLRSVGEIEYANGIAAMSASGGFGPTRVCAGIVGHCDLTAGDRAEELLAAHLAAGNGRLKGVRVNAYFDEYVRMGDVPPDGLLRMPEFRAGFARLQALGLVADVMVLHRQLPDLADLAATFPDTTIVVNHVGGPTLVGPYQTRRAEVRRRWEEGMRALSRCPNVRVKLGGLANPFFCGIDFRGSSDPPGSVQLALAFRPWFEPVIEWFGVDRCMFESNFPADKVTCSYPVLWNAFKRLAAQFEPAERRALFHDTAASVYFGRDIPAGGAEPTPSEGRISAPPPP
jgi:predicted TIM-barrel fold metal-dependent hydrolase